MLHKIILSLFSITLLTACHSKNSFEFCGTFAGILPAADGPGIETVISFSSDGYFKKTMIYLSDPTQSFNQTGFFKKEDGDILSLSATDGETSYYLMEKDRIRLLNFDRSIIRGPLEKNYILNQTAACR